MLFRSRGKCKAKSIARFKPSLRKAFCGAVKGLVAGCLVCGSEVLLELGVDFAEEAETGFTVDLAFVLAIGFTVNLVGGDMGFDCAFVQNAQSFKQPLKRPQERALLGSWWGRLLCQ